MRISATSTPAFWAGFTFHITWTSLTATCQFTRNCSRITTATSFSFTSCRARSWLFKTTRILQKFFYITFMLFILLFKIDLKLMLKFWSFIKYLAAFWGFSLWRRSVWHLRGNTFNWSCNGTLLWRFQFMLWHVSPFSGSGLSFYCYFISRTGIHYRIYWSSIRYRSNCWRFWEKNIKFHNDLQFSLIVNQLFSINNWQFLHFFFQIKTSSW